MTNSNVVEDTLGDHWFEADIEAKSSGSSTFWISSLVSLRVDTSTIAGSFAELDDPNNFELIKAGLSDNPNINVYPSSVLAENDLVFHIVDTVYRTSDPNNYPLDGMYLTSTSQLVAKVRLRISQCNNLATVDFYQPNMYNASRYYIDSLGWNYFQFSPVIVEEGFSSILCPDSIPVIYSISPKVITAGTFDTLTIYGANFGAFDSIYSNVYFRNADDGGITWVNGNGFHYKEWNDSTIKVWVPSWTTVLGSGDFSGAAGSGSVIVKTGNVNVGTAESSDFLDIVYSILNRLDSLTYGPPVMPDLIGQNGNGGYTFSVDSTFILAPNLTVQAKRALQKWVCATEVNFEIDSTSYSSAYNAWDGVNSLVFVHPDSMANPINLAETEVLMNLEWCAENNRTVIHVKDIDIAFRSNVNWYSTLPIPPTGKDFHSVILHEFGHAHLLGHALPVGKVMYKGISNNDTLRTLTNYDIDGGLRVMGFSTESHVNCISDEMLPLSLPNCPSSGPNSISDHIIPQETVILYPNPTSGLCTLRSTVNFNRIQVINILDETVLNTTSNKREVLLDLRSIKSGIYMIIGIDEGIKVFSRKLIRE